MASRDIVRAIQDLTCLDWNERASSSGTAGTYLKARTGSGSRLIYYKLPRYNGVVIDGYECVNELLASRLMDALGIEHLAYRLIHAKVLIDGAEYETWLNSSRNFRKVGERKLSLGAFFDLYKNPGESPMELCRRFGWQEDIARMMLVDYLMANRDRHASNIEVLAAPDGSFRIAPYSIRASRFWRRWRGTSSESLLSTRLRTWLRRTSWAAACSRRTLEPSRRSRGSRIWTRPESPSSSSAWRGYCRAWLC